MSLQFDFFRGRTVYSVIINHMSPHNSLSRKLEKKERKTCYFLSLIRISPRIINKYLVFIEFSNVFYIQSLKIKVIFGLLLALKYMILKE